MVSKLFPNGNIENLINYFITEKGRRDEEEKNLIDQIYIYIDNLLRYRIKKYERFEKMV